MSDHMVIRTHRMIPNFLTLDKFPYRESVFMPPTSLSQCREILTSEIPEILAGYDFAEITKGFNHVTYTDRWEEYTFETSFRIVPVVPMAMDTV